MNLLLVGKIRAVATVSAILCFSVGAQGVVIISNMPGNDGTSTFMNAPLGGSNGGGVFDSKAAGFTMPTTSQPYALDFVTLRLNFFNLDSRPIVQLYSNAGGNPGTPLHTLATPSFTVGMANYNFAATGSALLQSNTTYWVVVWNDALVANSFQWMASSPAQTPTGLATSAGYRFSNGPPPPTGNSSTFNSYSINATLVPEPATLGVLACGAVALLRRRRR
jgi:hypothetical protein